MNRYYLLTLLFLCPKLFADGPEAQVPGPSWHQFILIGVMMVAFYFIIIRPQNNRIKEQRELLSNLQIKDEVITTGGLVGIISKIDDNFIKLEVAPQVIVAIQKQAITASLPRGSLTNS